MLPTFALVSQALMGFAIDYEGCGGLALARSGNVLRAIGDEGIEIAVRPTTTRGMSPYIPAEGGYAGLERHAYGAVAVDPNDKRKGRFTLTEKGRLIRDAYDDIVVAIERRWKKRYGEKNVDALRRALTI